jgi:hypothetical protein
MSPLLCPSAQPDMEDARILGVLGGPPGAPRISYLDWPQPVSDELLALAHPLPPAEVYRFAARCEGRACRHFDGDNCNLATRIVQILPAVVDSLPACKIRLECRWYQQEGRVACLRCPQVITQVEGAGEQYRRAAAPSQ